MSLTYERLIEFNLIDEIEKEQLADSDYMDLMTKFFQLFNQIEKIDEFIKDSPSFPGSTDKIIRSELTSVIGATLSIEGTLLDKEQIEESFKKAENGAALKRKEQEAENSRKVYEFIRNFVNDHPEGFEYTEALIKQIHKYFTENIDYVSNAPGDYRNDFNVSFGDPRKKSLCRTRSETEEAMQKFIVWLNTSQTGLLNQNPFIKAIMAHYYLTEIHPFGDGNGRTARALEALILNAHGVNDYCFWSWANFWSAHKDQYLFHLHNIRATLDPTDFLIWGLEGYRDEINDIKQKVLTKVKQLMFSDYIHYLYRNKKNEEIKINQRIIDFLQLLIPKGRTQFKKFISSPEMIALYRGASASTRIRDIRKMLSLGLIRFSDNDQFIEANFQILERLQYVI